VQEDTCLIRPPAQGADFLRPLTPSIIVAAEGCPVDVIKFETKDVEGPAPWANEPSEAAASAAGGEVVARAPAAKLIAPPAPPDPKWQALLSNSKISPSRSASPPANLGTTVRKSPEVLQAEEMVRAVKLPKDAPPDQRMAMLAAGGAYVPATSMADRIRGAASGAAKSSRRSFNLALVVAWGALAAVTATFGAMFQDFFGPKVLKEPKKVYRVGKLEEFGNPGVYEQYKPSEIWVVNLQPNENKVIALSTICTHLGCIPAWLAGDQKFKCPCHGSGYYITGVNFEGPTPRPLERYAVFIDPDGYIMVDKSKVYRSELGEWESPESFVSLS
ncbi:MAG: Rieske 2Fe-2S domain-containing protein, partial [Tepidisphaeraceae bacterium]